MNRQKTHSGSTFRLITKERTQKLELLQHLISNLAHAIVVCGPEGVGKTFLLKCFQEASQNKWLLSSLKGDAKFNFDRIKGIIAENIKQNQPDFKFLSLDSALDSLHKRDLKLILIIDDAGLLEPGLIEKIIDYADNNPGLSCVFALTHSELYLKNTSDPSVEVTYQIEIPPLSEKQCGEFLEYLSTLPRAQIQFSSINETMVATLYRETHGIPGKIIKQLPDASAFNVKDYSKTALSVAVVTLIGIALGVQWWSNQRVKANMNPALIAANKSTGSPVVKQHPPAENNNLAPTQATKQDIVSSPVNITPPQPLEPSSVPIAQNTNSTAQAAQNNHQPATPPAANLPAEDQPEASQPQATDQVKSAGLTALENALIPENAETWLISQSMDNLTLQLMALPTEQPLLDVIKRHSDLAVQLKIIKTKTKSHKDRYILLYGTYTSPELAHTESLKLPKELQKTWLRKIAAIKAEIERATPPEPTPE